MSMDDGAGGPSAEELVAQFKRQGHFDQMRRQILSEFRESEEGREFERRLGEIVRKEIEQDPSLLQRDRGKVASLVGGAVDRTRIYTETKSVVQERQISSEATQAAISQLLRQVRDNMQK